MASTTDKQPAGAIDIQELTLISGSGEFIDMKSFLVELNLFEDIYSPALYGNIVVSDSVGLIAKLDMVGEEYLTIKLDTPAFESQIYKTFRCCGISDRKFTRDTTTEQYIIHFVSPELFMDHFITVQRSFSGNVDDIVSEIFSKYIACPRNLILKDDTITDSEDSTDLVIFTESKVPVKFISPSWTPMKCISWLASKTFATENDYQGANFLFFETSRNFYFGSLEAIIKEQREKQTLFGIYTYAPGNVKTTSNNTVNLGGVIYHAPDLERDFFSINELTVVQNVDALQNLQSGYLGSVFHELNIGKKEYLEIEYDHLTRFPDFQHMQQNAKGFFADGSARNIYGHQIIGFKNPGLFTGVNNNFNEFASKIVQPRTSQLSELNQIKLKIVIPGRTDAELGGLLYLAYPKSGQKTGDDVSKMNDDPYYSGLYLVTAIHHQITLENHTMVCEIVKDSAGDVNEANTTN